MDEKTTAETRVLLRKRIFIDRLAGWAYRRGRFAIKETKIRIYGVSVQGAEECCTDWRFAERTGIDNKNDCYN